jgi:hypothetical protein
MKTFLNKIILIFFPITLNLWVAHQTFQNQSSTFLVFLWILSLALFVLANLNLKIKDKKELQEKTKRQSDPLQKFKIFLLSALILLPSIVRVLNYHPNRLHGDDLLSAYFSATYNLEKDNFFAPVPKIKGEWVCQFPSPYFVFQKIFFLAVGENSLTVKLSVIPYVLIVSLMLSLVAKKVLNEKSAILSVVLYSFFPASLYLETLGLHFISSTAVFLTFFYFILSGDEDNLSATLAGLFCGFCYLFYTSSYIALPLLICFFTFKLITKRRVLVLKRFSLALIAFLLTTAPFLTYQVGAKNYYFTGRIDQVNLLSGTWSGTKERLKQGKTVLGIVKENLKTSVDSFYKDGVGGHGGYNFGHLALFEKFSLVLFSLGSTISLFLLLKNSRLAFVLITILIAFLAGMVFTIPPPAFHRFSIAFPFLVLIMGLPLSLLLGLKKISRQLLFLIIIPSILIYCWYNQKYFYKMTAGENDNANVKLTNYLQTNYPDRNIYVAAFPSYNFEKLFYFLKGNSNQKIFTEYHQYFLNNFDPKEKYLYVIIFPDAFEKQFKALDSKGKIIKFSKDYDLFVN